MSNIREIIRTFCQYREVKSIHVDEIVAEHLLKTKDDIFFNSIKVYNDFVHHLKECELPLAQIDLQIQLYDGSNVINGVPHDLASLIGRIDEFSMPEVFVHIPKTEHWQPKLEMYVCPLPFKIGELADEVHTLYQEYRTLDEFEEDSEFWKWLTFSYLKDGT